ncbi:hypothetical protein L249_3773 [Ophiocordyceps polyrhachis-furcata BCC 54312]|uniref:Uncharacterized protein n=1 Tax=Ophiocordyceps polyrhachis-furcata BCC 54312 TaxID=1330021 RepID=A0A367KZM8_9HYPO|nr:hypothetical protein L249_3773 [Ophiocordyceps polyrhachis-furcata BCC 54312]
MEQTKVYPFCHDSSESPRPLSKIRTNFVPINKSGCRGLRREQSEESNISRSRMITEMKVKSASTSAPKPDNDASPMCSFDTEALNSQPLQTPIDAAKSSQLPSVDSLTQLQTQKIALRRNCHFFRRQDRRQTDVAEKMALTLCQQPRHHRSNTSTIARHRITAGRDQRENSLDGQANHFEQIEDQTYAFFEPGHVKSKPKTLTNPAKVPTTLVAQTASPSGQHNRMRSSVGPPLPTESSELDSSVEKYPSLSDSFLARMTRPTQASTSRTTEKTILTPPKKRLPKPAPRNERREKPKIRAPTGFPDSSQSSQPFKRGQSFKDATQSPAELKSSDRVSDDCVDVGEALTQPCSENATEGSKAAASPQTGLDLSANPPQATTIVPKLKAEDDSSQAENVEGSAGVAMVEGESLVQPVSVAEALDYGPRAASANPGEDTANAGRAREDINEEKAMPNSSASPGLFEASLVAAEAPVAKVAEDAFEVVGFIINEGDVIPEGLYWAFTSGQRPIDCMAELATVVLAGASFSGGTGCPQEKEDISKSRMPYPLAWTNGYPAWAGRYVDLVSKIGSTVVIEQGNCRLSSLDLRTIGFTKRSYLSAADITRCWSQETEIRPPLSSQNPGKAKEAQTGHSHGPSLVKP